MPAKWYPFDPIALLPEEVLNAAEVLNDEAVTILTTILDVAAAALDIAKMLVDAVASAQTAVVMAIYEVIDAIIQTLTQSGFYMLIHYPGSFSTTLTPENWFSVVRNSFDDSNDSNRPILVSSTYLASFTIMGTSESLAPLIGEGFSNVFNAFNGLCASLDQINSWPVPYDPFIVNKGVGQIPNWMGKRFCDFIPGLSDLAEELKSLKGLLAPPSTTSDLFSQFAEILRDKAEIIRGYAEKIQNIIDMISAILGFKGNYVLPVAGTFTKDELLSVWQNSTGGPMDIEGANFTAGITFLAVGAADASSLISLFQAACSGADLSAIEEEIKDELAAIG